MVFVLKKKKIISLGAILLVLFFSLGILANLNSKETFFETEGKTIIIDAGHGAYSQYHKF